MYLDFAKIIKFLFSGGISACINLISRWIFFHFLPYSVSIILASLLGLASAFIIFKFFVFKSGDSGRTKKEIIFFLLVNMLSMTLTFTVSMFLAEILFPYINFTFYPYDIAHFCGVATPAVTSYFLHTKFTFGNTDNNSDNNSEKEI